MAAAMTGLLLLGKLSYVGGQSALLLFVCALAFIIVGSIFVRWQNSSILRRAGVLAVAGGLMVPFGAVNFPSFVKASFQSAANGCLNTLRQIDAAKQQWALENGKTNGTWVTEADLTPYIKLDFNGDFPKCPSGGTYIPGRIGEDPRCSISDSAWPNSHVLNDTNSGWWYDCKSAYRRVFTHYF